MSEELTELLEEQPRKEVTYACDFCDEEITFFADDNEMDEDENPVGGQYSWHVEVQHRPLTPSDRAARKGHIRRNFDASKVKNMARAKQVISNFSAVSVISVTTCPECQKDPS